MATASQQALNLTVDDEIVSWPARHYVYVEKIGPFDETTSATWIEAQKLIPIIKERYGMSGSPCSLYQTVATGNIYRAGVFLNDKPADSISSIDPALSYYLLPAASYTKFVLSGPYSQVPQACQRVFELTEEKQIPVDQQRFNVQYFVCPDERPEAEPITEILIPRP